MFINSRDRFTPLVELVDWLERAGCDEIYFLDNDSAYGPLLELYERTPHTVVRLGTNYGKWSLWQAPGIFELTKGRRFVYSDPDVIPAPECPLDALDRFGVLLDKYKLANKVGFALRTDDLPDHYRHKQTVVAYEAGMWDWALEAGAYWFPIDTTFALYREDASYAREAIRTGPPYWARHDTWYTNSEHPSEEEVFYAARAVNETPHTSGMAHWSREDVGAHHRRLAAEQRRPSATTRLRWRLRGRRAVRKGISR